MKIKISSASTCDLRKEPLDKSHIGIIPLSLILGDKVYSDGIDITPQQIFDYVAATKNLPKTAACTEESYAERFAAYLEDYDAVIHLNISSKASVTNRNAADADKQFNGEVKNIDKLPH